jgi:hypothetical protein
MIGIMADSHGQADAIRNALALITDAGCRLVYHLEIGKIAKYIFFAIKCTKIIPKVLK